MSLPLCLLVPLYRGVPDSVCGPVTSINAPGTAPLQRVPASVFVRFPDRCQALTGGGAPVRIYRPALLRCRSREREQPEYVAEISAATLGDENQSHSARGRLRIRLLGGGLREHNRASEVRQRLGRRRIPATAQSLARSDLGVVRAYLVPPDPVTVTCTAPNRPERRP